MTATFCTLLPELLEEIYRYCSPNDLLNVACCNKVCYENVRRSLWATMKIKWNLLENLNLVKEKTLHINFTKVLHINEEQSEDLHKKISTECDGFEYLIKQCNPSVLCNLRFENYIVCNAVELVSKMLPNVKELCMKNIYECHFVFADWNYLCDLKQLTVLTLYWVDLHDTHLKNIGDLEGLQELRMFSCDYITKIGLQFVSGIKNLKRLSIALCDNIAGDDFLPIAKLVKLEELDLSYSKVNDGFFVTACNKLTGLHKLDITSCYHVTNIGFSHIFNMEILERLGIGGSTYLTDDGLYSLCSLCKSLRVLELADSVYVTDTGLLYISKLPLLEGLDISICPRITDAGILYLSRLPSLKYLFIFACESHITPAGLGKLPKSVSIN